MFPLIYAQAAGDAATAPGGGAMGMQMLVMMAIVIAVMYFTSIAPQRKREKEKQDMLAALAKGDSVVTIGGICGTITHVSEQHVVIEVDKGTTLKLVREAISRVVKPV